MLSLIWVASAQEYGIDNTHFLVVPVPVAATVLVSLIKRGTPVVIASCTETWAVQLTVVIAVVLSVIVRVTVIVPPNVVRAAGSTLSSATDGTARNAPVCGSRNPRMPGLAEELAAWPQAAGATITQHMQVNNSFVNRMLSPFRIFLYFLFSNPVEKETGGGRHPKRSAQSSTSRWLI
jgi:hypothetical protein